MVRIYEKSSWGIVYRKNWDKVDILLLEWLNSKWQKDLVIPKWHMEEWETASQTAIRETSEETWLEEKDLEIIKFITKLNYTFTAWYLEDNPLIDKDVYLFLIKYKWTDIPNVQKEERFTWYVWVPIEEINKIDQEIKFDLWTIVNRNKTFFI